MVTQTTSTADREERFGEIVFDCLQAAERGNRPNRQRLLAEHPDFAAELADFLADFENVNQLATPLRAVIGQPNAFQHDLLTNGVLGDYRILREVGRGGMGVVYEAEQISLNRRVALKILPFAATMDAKQLQRFRNEAMAAASLRHENIVHVYGVGCERSVHFYAMELIDGQTLAHIIAALHHKPAARNETSDFEPTGASAPTAPVGALSTEFSGPKGKELYRSAARVIADAADALEHAHSFGVVHRDIKPANLMLDADGRVYVTDFGLARFGPDAGLTMSGDLLGTLRYMSPEQAMARHGLVDHRTDIYSLGATLYELLTGRPVVVGEDKQELLKHIAFEEPTPLRKVDRAIPVELETISLKALAKNPTERFASAKELGEDLRRWIGNKPISARRPTVFDRTGKWVARNRGIAALTMVILLLVLIGLVASVVVQNRHERKLQSALAEESAQRKLAQGISNFLRYDLLMLASPELQFRLGASELGKNAKIKDVLDRAAKSIGERLSDQPLVESAIRDTIGYTYRKLGEYDAAIFQFQRCVELRKMLFDPNDRWVLESQNALALAYLETSQFDRSIQIAEPTLAAFESQLGFNHPATLNCRSVLAKSFMGAGQVERALPLFEQILKQREASLPKDDLQVLISRSNLGQAYVRIGRFNEAIALFTEVLNNFEAKLGAEHPEVLCNQGHLAAVYEHIGRFSEAIKLRERILPIWDSRYGADHPESQVCREGLAKCYMRIGRHDKALPLLEANLRDLEARSGPDHPHTLEVCNDVGMAYKEIGRFDLAIPLLERSVNGLAVKLGPDHPLTINSRNSFATGLLDTDRFAQALPLFEENLRLCENKLGSDNLQTLVCLGNLGMAYQDSGQVSRAIPFLERALQGREAKLGNDHPPTIANAFNLATAYRVVGRSNDAIPIYRRAWESSKKTHGPEHDKTLMQSNGLALALMNEQQFTEAETVLREDLEVRERSRPDHWGRFSVM